MLTVLLILYHGTNVQYMCTAAFIVHNIHNIYRYTAVFTRSSSIFSMYVCRYVWS